MPPTPYPDLNLVLDELLHSVQDVLGEKFLGLYLQGSFALGDFDQHSDCDFIVKYVMQAAGEQYPMQP